MVNNLALDPGHCEYFANLVPIYLLSFVYLGPNPWHIEVPRLRGLIGAVAAFLFDLNNAYSSCFIVVKSSLLMKLIMEVCFFF